jgi:3-oxoacyl-(acyl-carrier-protein) synthase
LLCFLTLPTLYFCFKGAELDSLDLYGDEASDEALRRIDLRSSIKRRQLTAAPGGQSALRSTRVDDDDDDEDDDERVAVVVDGGVDGVDGASDSRAELNPSPAHRLKPTAVTAAAASAVTYVFFFVVGCCCCC